MDFIGKVLGVGIKVKPFSSTDISLLVNVTDDKFTVKIFDSFVFLLLCLG